MEHPISNSKQVVDLDSFNSGDIYLSSLGKFSSFVIPKCSPTFLSLLVPFLALCYSSKMFLTFLTEEFFTNSVKLLPYILLLTVHQFSKALNLRLFASQNLRNTTIFQYAKIYEAMENEGIALFYRFCVVAAIITMR